MGNILDGIVNKIGNALDLKSVHDRLDENFDNGIQVAAMPLAKNSTKLAKEGVSYFFKPTTGGHSARDIIRHERNIYPMDVFKPNVNLKDESIQGKYYYVDSFGVPTIVEGVSSLEELKRMVNDLNKSVVGNHYTAVSNIKSSRKSKEQKDFEQAFADYSDIKGTFKHIQKSDPLPTKHGRFLTEQGRNKFRTFINEGYHLTDKRDIDRKYYVDFMAAKERAHNAGRNLAKKFAEENKSERGVYAGIVTDYNYTAPSYTLGGQNHTFSDNNADQSGYENIRFLERNKRRVQYDENGNPIVKGYHWTDKGNIAPIMKSGLIETIGPDSEHYGAMKGAWMSGNDKNPMYKNFFNGGTVGSGNFNEDLLEVQTPLKDYNRRLVTHDPMRNAKVDIFRSRPSDNGIMIERNGVREYARVPVPKENIQVHPEDSYYFNDWVMDDNIAGWHPNKMYGGTNREFLDRAFEIARKNDIADEKTLDNIELYAESNNQSDKVKAVNMFMELPGFNDAFRKDNLRRKSIRSESIEEALEGKPTDNPLLMERNAKIQNYFSEDNLSPYKLNRNPFLVSAARGSIAQGNTPGENAFNILKQGPDIEHEQIRSPKVEKWYADLVGDNTDMDVFNKHTYDLGDKFEHEGLKSQMAKNGINLNFNRRERYLKNAGIDFDKFTKLKQDAYAANWRGFDVKKGDPAYGSLPLEDRLKRYKAFKSRAEASKFADEAGKRIFEIGDRLNELYRNVLNKIGIPDERIDNMSYFEKFRIIDDYRENFVDEIKKINELSIKRNELVYDARQAERLASNGGNVSYSALRSELEPSEKRNVFSEMTSRGYFPERNDVFLRPDKKFDAFRSQAVADSLDRVIGHQLGRKIGAYRASRGKYGKSVKTEQDW